MKYTQQEYEIYQKVKLIKLAEDILAKAADMSVDMPQEAANRLAEAYDRGRCNCDLSFDENLECLINEYVEDRKDDLDPIDFIDPVDTDFIRNHIEITNIGSVGDDAISRVPFSSLSERTRRNVSQAVKLAASDIVSVIFTWSQKYGNGVKVNTNATEAGKYIWNAGTDIEDSVLSEIVKDIPKFREEVIDKLYEAYKMDWMVQHGYNLKDFVLLMADMDYCLNEIGDYPEGTTAEIYEKIAQRAADDESELFSDENKWVSKGEFKATKMTDLHYMEILGVNLRIGIDEPGLDLTWNKYAMY